MNKTQIGTNPDGSPRWEYSATEEEKKQAAAGQLVCLYPGNVSGTLVMADGTAYDIGEDWVPVAKQHHAEVLVGIHKAHHRAGRFLQVPCPTVEEMQAQLDAAAEPA